ncbi:MAG: PhzF family phenazine biosynthesis protein, partial [Phycisphaerae bacterium]
MKLKMWQVDAFAGKVFAGNPAAVVVLEGGWLEEGVMQGIAGENNLSETAFVAGSGGKWEIRWFTPTTEVDLCGHATLGAAHVIGTEIERGVERMEFGTKAAGVLGVERKGERWVLDFPARKGVREVDAGVMENVSG